MTNNFVSDEREGKKMTENNMICSKKACRLVVLTTAHQSQVKLNIGSLVLGKKARYLRKKPFRAQ